MSRALIVSDDLEIRHTLVSMLSPELWMMLPECISSTSAVSEINRLRPRLVVIQAELQHRSGLDLASELLRLYDPAIILVSKSGAMAARAFDIGVDDFIVAPLRRERLSKAIQRALGPQFRPETVTAAASAERSVSSIAKLRVKSKGGFIFLKCEELVWVEAAGNYLNLHCLDRVYRVREPLTEFNARLDSANFVRIHRSLIVNTSYIRELRSWGMGDYVVVLRNSKELPVSRSYRGSLDSWMTNSEFSATAESSSEEDSADRSTVREDVHDSMKGMRAS
jgi:two-component system LytT family response regulator